MSEYADVHTNIVKIWICSIILAFLIYVFSGKNIKTKDKKGAEREERP